MASTSKQKIKTRHFQRKLKMEAAEPKDYIRTVDILHSLAAQESTAELRLTRHKTQTAIPILVFCPCVRPRIFQVPTVTELWEQEQELNISMQSSQGPQRSWGALTSWDADKD